MIEIVLLGRPRAKGRPRFTRDGHAFTPAKTREYEGELKYAAQQVMGDRPPLDGPLVLDIVTVVPVAASWPKRKQAAALAGDLLPTSKPDWDNYGKVVDALNLVVWVDDGQIVDGRVRKVFGAKPGMWITVRPYVKPTTDGVFG